MSEGGQVECLPRLDRAHVGGWCMLCGARLWRSRRRKPSTSSSCRRKDWVEPMSIWEQRPATVKACPRIRLEPVIYNQTASVT
jgi:hypothetical protein